MTEKTCVDKTGCNEPATYDSPADLCNEHWENWWVCQDCVNGREHCERHTGLREIRPKKKSP